jgi:hypothetical protein
LGDLLVLAYRNFTRLLATTAILGMALAACSGGSSQVPSTGSGSGSNPSTSALAHFRAATASDKAQQRPSLTAQSGTARVDSPVGGTGVGPTGSGYYTLVTLLAVDDNLNYSELGSRCDASIFDAPWYWAQGNISITQPEFPVLSVCDASTSHWFAAPGTAHIDSPVSSPTATPSSSSGTYIIAVDIGWFSLAVTPLSGAATESGGNWTFSALVNPVQFTNDHLYAFFVANWTPTSSGH